MNDNPKPGKNGFKFPEHSIKTKITDVNWLLEVIIRKI